MNLFEVVADLNLKLLIRNDEGSKVFLHLMDPDKPMPDGSLLKVYAPYDEAIRYLDIYLAGV